MNNLHLKLSDISVYLTGRTLAKNKVKELGALDQYQEIILDFESVVAFAQSFGSELLFQMKQQQADLNKIKWVNVTQPRWQKRLIDEIEFLKTIH